MLKSLQWFTTAASFGIGIGVILFIFGLIENDSTFAAVGAGITVASIVLFLFGLSLGLMEEHTEKNSQSQKGPSTYSRKSL